MTTEVEVYAVRDEEGVSLEHDSDLPVDTVNAPRHYIDKRLVSDGQRVMTAEMDGRFSYTYSIPDDVATGRAYEKGWAESQQPTEAYCAYCGETKAVVRGVAECIECETVTVVKSKKQYEEIVETDMSVRDVEWDTDSLPNVLTGEGMVACVGRENENGGLSDYTYKSVVPYDGTVRMPSLRKVVDRYVDRTKIEGGMVAMCVATDTGGQVVRAHIDPRCANESAYEHDHSDGSVDDRGVEVYVECGMLHRAAECDEHPRKDSEVQSLEEKGLVDQND